ncbi:VOC family protein [Angustibacter sp. McL0619]|uniref:VOC family protein n=1 Tax=Angustibacter sp. McL0619 TaxID=3415676 RepID=UPI003CEAC762
MLGDSKAFSGFAVDDVERARTFYTDVLGLDVSVDAEMGFIRLALAGGGSVMIYPKSDFTPATYTVLNFPVPDVTATVRALAGRGVQFTRYDGFGQDEDGIARGPQGPAIAWFSDPAGNIMSVIETADDANAS